MVFSREKKGKESTVRFGEAQPNLKSPPNAPKYCWFDHFKFTASPTSELIFKVPQTFISLPLGSSSFLPYHHSFLPSFLPSFRPKAGEKQHGPMEAKMVPLEDGGGYRL
jgi:hypothetical protein